MKKYSVPIINHLSLLQETWDKAYQEGYAKGRVRCLEQHRGEELEKAKKKAIEDFIEKQALVVSSFTCSEHKKPALIPQCLECKQEEKKEVLAKIIKNKLK